MADQRHVGAAGARTEVSRPKRPADQAVTSRATALYGVRSQGAMWVTECAWCNRVRTVAGEWQTLTLAIRSATDVERTHGIGPEYAEGCLTRAMDIAPRLIE